jgi:glycolate oxidase iron-sulfur subunit
LHVHAGEREAARALARRNIDAFLETDVQWVVVNSAGCGSAMKGYGELLQRDEAYQAKAERFSTMLQDVHEFLIKIGFQVPAGPLERRVTYQDPCHLLHGQRVRSAPRQILQAIPGLELVEMAEADMCCGAGGLYNVLYPAFAGPILERKLDHIKRAAPHIVATANPGCMMQFQGGAASRRLPVRVAHVMELLDEAYQKTP